jgi:trehalose-6-phosphatase
MKVKFIKDIGNYKAGDVVDLELLQAKAYIECRKAVLYKGETPKKNIADLPYKELRNLCKLNKIPAVGTRESMILALNGVK